MKIKLHLQEFVIVPLCFGEVLGIYILCHCLVLVLTFTCRMKLANCSEKILLNTEDTLWLRTAVLYFEISAV